jgi:hypothetical protein
MNLHYMTDKRVNDGNPDWPADERPRNNSVSAIFAHNHSSGNFELSRADETITKAIKST